MKMLSGLNYIKKTSVPSLVSSVRKLCTNTFGKNSLEKYSRFQSTIYLLLSGCVFLRTYVISLSFIIVCMRVCVKVI